MDQQTPTTRVLYIDRSNCPDTDVCPAVIELRDVPDWRGMVTRAVMDPVTDPGDPGYVPPLIAIKDERIATLMEEYVGPGEVGTLVPAALIAQIEGGAR